MMQSADQNEPTIEDLLGIARDYIGQAITDDWAEAVLVAVIEDDQSGLTYGRYQRAGHTDQHLCFDTDYRMYLVFDALRQQARERSDQPWYRAEYTLHRNGKSNLKLTYSNGNTSDFIISPTV